MDLSEKDKLGTAIGGLTAPIIGLISTILLYLALSKQTEANNEQRLKNESDIIFLLFNQLDTEINSFRTHQYRETNGTRIDDIDIGAVGLKIFCHRCTKGDYQAIIRGDRYGFHGFQEATHIIFVIESYLLIEKRINSASLSNEMKDLFQSKLKAYYELKLREGLKVLSEALISYQVSDQPMPKRIIEFVKGR